MVGDDRAFVLQQLGPPNGHIGSSSFEILYFDRGEVVLRNGSVQSHTLISPADLERRQQAAEQERAARAQRELEERKLRIDEGNALRERALSDPAFAALSARDRMNFWQSFKQTYPEIDVEFEHLLATRQARTEAELQAEARRQAAAEEARIRALEQRVEEAERQARIAQERERTRSYHHDYYYPPSHYPARSPVVIIHDRSKDRHNREHDRDRSGSRRSSGEDRSGQPPARQVEPPTTSANAFERAEGRRQAFNDQWAAREEQFAREGQIRQQAFEARREAAWPR